VKTCPVCDTLFPDQHATCPTDGAVLIESRELAPGHIVRGKYRIVRKIGQGGMGAVYLAEHLLLGGQVALKFLAVELSRNPEFVKRFRNEARAAYQLRHRNIVEVTDLDQETDGTLFIAMEFVDGMSLRSALRQSSEPLPIPRVLNIARGVAAGLAVAHARRAVHRDIKPDNILLTIDEDGEECAKVLDFGIAVMTEGVTSLSRTHGLLLTPEYAAPEQWRGMPAAELDGRADLYALGGVLYEMLAGRTPFRATNPEGWMFQHLYGELEPLGKLRPDIARTQPELEALVMRLLARDRDDRFPSASIILEALEFRRPATIAEPVVAPIIRRTVAPPPLPTAPLPLPRPLADPTSAAEPPSLPVVKPTILRRLALNWKFLAAVWLIGIAVLIGQSLIPEWLNQPVAYIPNLIPVGGTYPEAQPITIVDATPNAVIHYTVDGSEPTEQSPIYRQPLQSLPNGTVVRAMATAHRHKPSPEINGTYIWSGPAKPAANPQQATSYDQGKSAYDHKQYADARTFFAQACNTGDLRGCNYLGYLYAEGLGGPNEIKKARAVYQNACERGNLSSCASLGTLYQEAGNATEVRKYFKKACDGGLKDGCDLLQGIN